MRDVVQYIQFCNAQRQIAAPPTPAPKTSPGLAWLYHRYSALLSHWDRRTNPGLLGVLRAFEAVIRKRETEHEAEVDSWLRSW